MLISGSKSNYLNKNNDGEEFRTYSRFLDVPDTIFAVNFFIGYFGTTKFPHQ